MGVSGNSNVGKSYSSFIISEDLLAKVTEAVQAGEKQARSSGNIQSFEVFYRGFRANICIGRIYVIPASICSDRKDFPTALLYGCIVREFGGEEVGDMIEKRIGISDWDEYSQADFDTIKERLFGVGDGKFESLVLFAPNWLSKREYIVFKFTKDETQLKNNLRHQVFAAYYDPRLSSAFNAIMTNANTTKIDVTDITPKLNFPFLAENLLTQYPDLQKQAGNKKKIFLNHRTADAVTQEVLDPQELDVFESLNQALSEALVPSTETAEEAGEEHHDDGGFDVPRVASKEAMSYESMKGLAKSHESENSVGGRKPDCGCNFCKNKSTSGKKDKEDAPKTGAAEAFGGRQAPPFGSEKKTDKQEGEAKSAADKKCKTCHATLMGDEARGDRCNKCLDEAAKRHKDAHEDDDRGAYVSFKIDPQGNLNVAATELGLKEIPAYKDKPTDNALMDIFEDLLSNGWEWKNPEDVGALTSAPILLSPSGNVYWHERYQIEDPIEMLANGETVRFDGAGLLEEGKTSGKKCACIEPAAHETPITNVGPGTEAAAAQEGTVKAVKERVEKQEGEPPIGVAIDETGVPRREEEEAKVGSKKTSAIEDDTPILPTVIADSVIREVQMFFVGKGLQDSIGENTEPVVDYLTNYAERVYAANTAFRKRIRSRGNAGRDYLYAFMRHWLAGWLKDHSPEAFRQLPSGFASGEELPRTVSEKKATNGDSQNEENPLQNAAEGVGSAISTAVKVLPEVLASDKEAAITKNRSRTGKRYPGTHPDAGRLMPASSSNSLGSGYSAAYGTGGFHDKHSFPPKDVRAYLIKTTTPDAQPHHAMLDHAAEIDAGKWGPNPTLKTAAQQIKADFIAEHIAADFDEGYEVASLKTKKAYDEREAKLNKLRPKQADVALDIDSIWEEITEDMGPAPVVDIDVPGETATQPEGSTDGRPNKKDVGELPEAFKSDEPEDDKALSEPEAEAQEDSMPEAKQEHDEPESDKPWQVSSSMEDFVKEAADELESDAPKFGCDQCEMLSINGIPCHELGCPNGKKTWVPEKGWVRYNECPICGSDVEEGESCNCQEPSEEEELYEKPDLDKSGEPLEGDIHTSAKKVKADKPKRADIADNAVDADKGEAPTKETGESSTVQHHKEYDKQQSKGAGGFEKQVHCEKHPAWDATCRGCQAAYRAAQSDEKPRGYEAENLRHHPDFKSTLTSRTGVSQKKADTADNPYNWKDGDGAPEDKKNAVKADTSGPNARSASALGTITTPKPKKPIDNIGPSDGPTGQKLADGIQQDLAKAKAESVSPYATNSNTKPETTSAEELRSKTAAEPTGKFDGLYVTAVYSKGGITLKPTPELLNEVAENKADVGKGFVEWNPQLHDLLEDFTGNGWEWVNPEDIGALTSGEIISDPGGNVYWHERYQIEDMVEELVSGKNVWMQYGGNLYDEEEPASEPDPNQMSLPLTSSDVSRDVAEAKSETVSPDTVDTDIHQETESVPEAAKVAAPVSGDVAEAKSETVSPDTVDPSIKRETKSVPEAAKVSASEIPVAQGETESGKQPVSNLGGGAPEALDVPAILASDKEASGLFESQEQNPRIGGERASRGECPRCFSPDTETFTVAEGKKMFCHECNQIVWTFGQMAAGKEAAAGDNLPEEIPIDLGAGDLADVVMAEEPEAGEDK